MALKWMHIDGSRSETRGQDRGRMRGQYVISRRDTDRGVWWEAEYIPPPKVRRCLADDDYTIAYVPTFLEAMRAAEEHHAERTRVD